MRRLTLAFVLLASCACADVATIPTNLSARGVSDWAIVGGWIGSGTGALPAAGATGSYFVDISTPSAPVLYRSSGSAWVAISSGGGATAFADLTDIATRTGNAGKILAVTGDEAGYEWAAASGTTGVASHSLLTELDFASSGHTGFASEAALAGLQPVASMSDYAAAASLTAHASDQVDPHGATQTISVSLQVGSGTPDLTIDRPSSGTMRIASYVVLVPEIATPTDALATGTLWYDGNVGKLRCYDGSAWNNLW
jgi:hypothetical protein